MLSQIGQIGMSVTNLDRSVKFYRDSLGLMFLFQVPNMAFFDCAGIRLLLGLPEPGGEKFQTLVYFSVADIQQTHQELVARGVAFENQPHLVAHMEKADLWLAEFRDPDRNVLALMSEVPRA